MYIRNGAWGTTSGFGNVEKNSEEDERGAAGECVSRQLLFFFRWKRQMGQRMNEENQEQDQKDEIVGKQEEPGQIVSEKVEKKREEKPKKKRLRIQGAAWRRLDNTAKLFAAVSGEDLSSVFRISAVLTIDDLLLEIPAGGRDSLEEDFLVCAARELEEEIGYRSDEIHHLVDYHSAAAYTSEKIAIYYTEKLIPSKQHLDENEFVQIERYSLEELNEMIFDGRITDGKTIAGIMAYQMLKHKNQE